MNLSHKAGWSTLLLAAVVSCSSQSSNDATKGNTAPSMNRGACGGSGTSIPLDQIGGPSRQGRDFMPDTPDANRQNLQSAWTCSAETTELDFRSGVELEERSAPSDPTAMFQAMAQDDKTASVESLAHGPALVIDPSKDPSGTTSGGVDLVINQSLLVVVGNTHISATALEHIADSLRPA